MCGLAGFAGYDRALGDPVARACVLDEMGSTLDRRGPDEATAYDDGWLALVYRRLSIMDLSGGQQPIFNEDRSLFVVLNGEIYNHHELRSELEARHTFRTRSDAEVILHLYEAQGSEALQKLNGMFAIVIYDLRHKLLFLARDRFGIKPLYYAILPNGVLFASELKALLRHPRCPRDFDWAALSNVGRGRIPSYVRGINILPGGTFAEVGENQRWRECRYWSLEEHFVSSDEAPHPERYYIERYADLLEDSVNKTLMGEVPVGLFLSGGLDSSVVAAIAARQEPGLNCFSVLERATWLSGDAVAARQLCESRGLPFHPVLFDFPVFAEQIGFGLEYFEHLIWLMDSPRTLDLEWLMKYELHRYAKTVVPNIKVMLLGQGADEFAGGYSQARDTPSHDWNEYVSQKLRLSFVRDGVWRSSLPRGIPEWLLADADFPMSSVSARDLFERERVMRVGFMQWYNLWHEDRTSSGQSIEARVPFLDHRLVEHLASVPPPLQASLFFDKRIVREAARRWLPEELLSRPKIRFLRSPDQRSVEECYRALLMRTFPEYCEKYLRQTGRSTFDRKALETAFASVVARDTKAQATAQRLFSCMGVDVFRALCLDPTSFRGVSKVMLPPSPLHVVDVSWKPSPTWCLPAEVADSGN